MTDTGLYTGEGNGLFWISDGRFKHRTAGIGGACQRRINASADYDKINDIVRRGVSGEVPVLAGLLGPASVGSTPQQLSAHRLSSFK